MDASEFNDTFHNFLTDELPVSSATVFSTDATNYDLWDDQIRVRAHCVGCSKCLRLN